MPTKTALPDHRHVVILSTFLPICFYEVFLLIVLVHGCLFACLLVILFVVCLFIVVDDRLLVLLVAFVGGRCLL